MRLFDFFCQDCGEVAEKLVDTDIRAIKCDCGGKATRIMGMPTVKLDGTDPAFPGAYSKWADIREANARIKGKRSYVSE